MRRRRLAWVAMAAVLAVFLTVGATRSAPRTEAERVRDFAESVRCPRCGGQSVADSDAPIASAIREDIGDRFAAGQSDAQIRQYLVGRFGESILLTPSGSGVSGLVWALPVVALVVAVAGLAFAFRRWRRWDTAGVGW